MLTIKMGVKLASCFVPLQQLAFKCTATGESRQKQRHHVVVVVRCCTC